jgi:hypothetical protein
MASELIALICGLVCGANMALLIYACCIASSRASRWEEYQDELKKNLDHIN